MRSRVWSVAFGWIVYGCGGAPLDDAPGAFDGPLTNDGGAPTGAAGAEGAADGACAVRHAKVSAAPEGASWRHGGGVDYPDILAPEGLCTKVVATREELEAALAASSAGDVVYVADDARIDLSGRSLCIPGGVTLASGRGRAGSAGGLLHVTVTESKPMLQACGDDVRVTGLRLAGSEPTECPPEWPDRCTGEDRTGGRNCRDCMPRSRGIQAKGHDRLEVDNCEITGFTYGAVELTKSLDNHVHHSHIHHNRRQGLGYGVVLSNTTDPASVLVEWNRFDFNRHSVAGSGAVGQSYEARNNVVLGGSNGHVFDMHGIDEATKDGRPEAGSRILIHDNTVLNTRDRTVVVRGRPTEGAFIYSNCLAQGSADAAFLQRLYFGNFHADRSAAGRAPNRYGQSASQCGTVFSCAVLGGVGARLNLTAATAGPFGLADFDGDGRTDVLRADGREWSWSSGGRGPWQRLNASTARIESLAFGDFDGDGKSDVFRADGKGFFVSRGGSSPWEQINTSSATLAQLRFGDFDGDGKTDVFRADGTAFLVSRGGRSPWERLNTSTTSIAELRFGDFDGDGKTDVFRAGGGAWWLSKGGSSPWEQINKTNIGVDSLAFGDFDGDGKTDVLRADGTHWLVSWGGRGRWQALAVSSESVDPTALGDFDGDGRTDVFLRQCP